MTLLACLMNNETPLKSILSRKGAKILTCKSNIVILYKCSLF